ncbi:MAG: glycosyltransferase family 4 protein [Cetobacterium sp.]|uniref:glycosyltransferase family 4 protein n=1 Tax=Cetobacterium sp. TaxID=2071632 RepID=UPI003F3EA31A
MQNKRILFITHRYPKGKTTILEKDTAKSLFNKGNKVVVIAPTERRNNEETHIHKEDGIEILYIKTGNNFNETSKIEKIVTVLIRPFLIKRAIKKYYSNEKFDVIFGYTPFMANYKLFSSLKRKYNSKLILFLWDIFPQNARDLGLFKNQVIFKFLKYREKMMYKIFDKIICNCEGQIDYILKNNYNTQDNLILIRNSEFIGIKKEIDKQKLKKELGYNKKDIISIFGGNMGEPQELENIVNMIKELKDYNNLKFIFLGDGTQKSKLKKMKIENTISNLEILDFVEREKYEKILNICDVGLISLSKKYTVPNFPAKVTGYIKEGIPIFASLDSCSLEYLGQFIKENEIGEACLAGDILKMKSNFLDLVNKLNFYDKNNFEKIFSENFNANNIINLLKKELGDEENV